MPETPSVWIKGPKGLMTVAFLVITVWGIAAARPFLIPLCISALLAFMMAPWVRTMRKLRIPEWLAITVSAVLLILPFLSLIYLLVWQGQELVKDLPSITRAANSTFSKLIRSGLGHRLHLADDLDLTFIMKKFEGSAGQGLQLLVSGMGALLDAGSQLALILLFSVMMLVSRSHLRRSTERILKESLFIKRSEILDDVVNLIEKFLIARLLIVLIVGGLDLVILRIFGVRYALLMSSFLGVMTVIPAVGFIMSVIPPILVSFAMGKGLVTTLLMVIALVVISIIEGNVLTPKMVGKRLNINALSTFIGLFGGGLLWGIWGMFLSIPVLGILRISLSAAPTLRPWGELLVDRDEAIPTLRRVR